MSFKEVKELRQKGMLDEAFALAMQDLEGDPNEIWNKRSIAWVFYEFLKSNSTVNNFETFISYLNKIIDLDLPESETMVFDNVAFQLAKIIFSINRENPNDFEKINRLFELVKKLHFTKPSESYGALFNSFLKFNREWPKFIEFADWWDFNNFRPEDFLKEELPDGKTVISRVERAYIAYARKLTESINGRIDINREEIDSFSIKLDQLIESHPEYQYPPYFKAKLMLALGGGPEGLAAFLPFAQKKRNDFWVWDLMADIFIDDEENRLACLCRGLLCKTSDEFLVKIREKLASILISKGFFEEATIEVAKILNIRVDNGWKIDKKIEDWMNASWLKLDKNKNDNIVFYKKYSRLADEILFNDFPEEIAVVDFINPHKKMLNFIVDKNKHGFFKYDRYIDKVQIGDILKIRFDGEGKDGYYKVFTIKQTDKQPDQSVLKDFEGSIRRRDGQNFGFVDDIFIEPKIVSQHQLIDGDMISGKAIISFNKNKNEWGWKGFKLNAME